MITVRQWLYCEPDDIAHGTPCVMLRPRKTSDVTRAAVEVAGGHYRSHALRPARGKGWTLWAEPGRVLDVYRRDDGFPEQFIIESMVDEQRRLFVGYARDKRWGRNGSGGTRIVPGSQPNWLDWLLLVGVDVHKIPPEWAAMIKQEVADGTGE